MTRARAAGHAWLLLATVFIALGVYAATLSLWIIPFTVTGCGTAGALAAGCYLKACREERIAARIAQLRNQPACDPGPPPRRPCCPLWAETGGKVHNGDGTCLWPDWARTSLTEGQEHAWGQIVEHLGKDTPA